MSAEGFSVARPVRRAVREAAKGVDFCPAAVVYKPAC